MIILRRSLILFKRKNTFMPPAIDFASYWFLMYQAIQNNKILILSNKLVIYNYAADYNEYWLEIFFNSLPSTLLSLKNYGLRDRHISSIIRTSLINRTVILSVFYLSYKSSIKDRISLIANLIKYSSLYINKLYILTLISLVFISPLYPFAKQVKNLRKLFK